MDAIRLIRRTFVFETDNSSIDKHSTKMHDLSTVLPCRKKVSICHLTLNKSTKFIIFVWKI